MFRRPLASFRFSAFIALLLACLAFAPGALRAVHHHARAHSRVQTRGHRSRSRTGFELRESGHAELSASLKSGSRDKDVPVSVAATHVAPQWVSEALIAAVPERVRVFTLVARSGRAPPAVL